MTRWPSEIETAQKLLEDCVETLKDRYHANDHTCPATTADAALAVVRRRLAALDTLARNQPAVVTLQFLEDVEGQQALLFGAVLRWFSLSKEPLPDLLARIVSARASGSDGNLAPILVYLKALARQQDEALAADLGRLFQDTLPDSEQHTLDELYVELEAEPGFTLGAVVSERDAIVLDSHQRQSLTVPALVDRMPGARFALLGEPGSGKTTLLRHLALSRAWQTLAAVDRRKPPGPAAIPILIPLRDLREGADDPFEYVERELRGELDLPAGIGQLLGNAAAAGQVLLLLDGLDEVAPEQVERRCKKIRALASSSALVECTMILSARTSGYLEPAPSFRRLRLLPLSPGSQERLLAKWLGTRGATLAALSNHLQSTASLAYLAGNPFFLTLIALLVRAKAVVGDGAAAGGQPWLPSSRPAALLREAVEVLLDGAPRSLRDRRHRGALIIPHRTSVRPVLEDLALALLGQGAGPYAEEMIAQGLAADMSTERLIRRWPESPTPERFIEDVSGRTMLLVREAGKARRWNFLHRSVQEHLAACALSRRDTADWTARARHLSENPKEAGRWAETFALLVGELSGSRTPTGPDELLGILAEHNHDLALRALASAGPGAVSGDTVTGLLSLKRGGDNWEARRKVIESIFDADRFGTTTTAVGLLSRILESTRHGADVYFVREALERIAREAVDEDARAQARLVRDQLFQHFPDAPDLTRRTVRVLDEKNRDCWVERPYWSETVRMPDGNEIRIGRLPVTNGLYEVFDPGHEAERWNGESSHAGNAYLDHPVVNVTWYEAHSFCLWLSTKNPGVRLPSEAEWEQAATNGDGRVYPWGNQEPDKTRANFGYSVGGTTRAGAYPTGEAHCGARDLAGNVWEWCTDEIDAKGIGTGVDRARALRGGSWRGDAVGLLAVFRLRFRAGDLSWNFGFRCIWSPREHVHR